MEGQILALREEVEALKNPKVQLSENFKGTTAKDKNDRTMMLEQIRLKRS